MDKELTQAFAKVARGIAGECKTCGGSGKICDVKNSVSIGIRNSCAYNIDSKCTANNKTCMHLTPCPTCAKVRDIAEWEWRSTDDKTWRYDKPFTVQILRATLETLGLWEDFKDYIHFGKWQGIKDGIDGYDVCSTDNLMAEATLEFLEGLCEKK
jgi:hypothetical protein